MNLNANHLFRLYAVSEKEDSGKHTLEAFDVDVNAYNEAIDEGELDDNLRGLGDVLFGENGCHHFELVHGDVSTENGRICFDDGDDHIEVRDIYDKIDADPEECRFFVIVNASRTAYGWVVAVPQGTVYSG